MSHYYWFFNVVYCCYDAKVAVCVIGMKVVKCWVLCCGGRG